MLSNPITVFGLGDGGAHCNQICDASMTTYMLTHWVRDRDRGPRLTLEQSVRKITHDTASLYGLSDRGLIKAGLRADLNLIDMQELQLSMPTYIHDLPAGAGRFVQKARGYNRTIVAGVSTFVDGEHTGALPGRLLRGAR